MGKSYNKAKPIMLLTATFFIMGATISPANDLKTSTKKEIVGGWKVNYHIAGDFYLRHTVVITNKNNKLYVLELQDKSSMKSSNRNLDSYVNSRLSFDKRGLYFKGEVVTTDNKTFTPEPPLPNGKSYSIAEDGYLEIRDNSTFGNKNLIRAVPIAIDELMILLEIK